MGCGVSSQGGTGQQAITPGKASSSPATSSKGGSTQQKTTQGASKPSAATSLLVSAATGAVAACSDGSTPLTVEGFFTAATSNVIGSVTGQVNNLVDEVSSDVAETQAAISALQAGDATQVEGLIDSLMIGVGTIVGAVNAAQGGEVNIKALKLPDSYSKAENMLKNYSVVGQVAIGK